MERVQHFIQAAVELAREGMKAGKGGPFGCVIVKGDVIVGQGCNCVTSTNDPTAHAEVVAIRDACQRLKTFQLTDCEIYTSCEPCPMCLGAIYWARPAKVYFAATRHDAADAGFDDSFIYEELDASQSERRIPMLPAANDAALQLFEEWKQWSGKKRY
ncbi:MAG: nucleoside deaminase [Candidatus Pseudobacter hemicellulosilyticus]|uniref:Nucleoside deaminase n=1 Tax=Candidatus Pseudobacter hemicellulosilyticus TaxID=3121375 RepID=A0AAJ6BHX0_9BACT|nr:MAG: nucleoside deaminase [Pseudobacter sp.]